MSDLIDRQALLKQIDIDSDGEPGYYGDTWKFIDTIKSMPSAELGANLAEVGTDCISRQAVKHLDLFTKTYCRDKRVKDDLVFRCNQCDFRLQDDTCLVKTMARKLCPDYREFGSMGDL